MLKALDETGRPCLAWNAVRVGEYRCPECHDRLILKQGRLVVEHFAHRPDSGCAYGTGESLRHMQMKAQIGRLFPKHEVDYEVCLFPGRRADVVLNDFFVVECQESALSIEEWEARTADYGAHRYHVLWVWDLARLAKRARGKTFLSMEEEFDKSAAARWDYGLAGEAEFRIPAEIRHCHRHSFGRVYALDAEGDLQAVHFGQAEARFKDGGPDWPDSSYTPRTLKTMRFHATTLKPRVMAGTEGEKLVGLGDGIWWK